MVNLLNAAVIIDTIATIMIAIEVLRVHTIVGRQLNVDDNTKTVIKQAQWLIRFAIVMFITAFVLTLIHHN